ncbi:MAG: glycosyltransferase family 4 protein [Streptosporangiaceae bacterium]
MGERDRLHVAFVLGTSTGGVGRHVCSLVRGLVGRGASVAVLGPAETEEAFGFAAAGARFAPMEMGKRPRPLRDTRALVHLRRLLGRTDVVHAHGMRAAGLAALALAGTRRAIPLVVTLHNAPPGGGASGAAYALLERVVIARADAVLCVSADLVARAHARGARVAARALVLAPPPRPMSRDEAAVRAELDIRGRPLVLAVGRLAAQKDYPTLLDAAARWATRAPPPLVAVVGDGPLGKSLASRIRAESLPVRLLGSRDDVPDLLAAADVVAISSLWEGPSMVAQEALRAGCPVVATRVGGVPETVGDAALLVPPGDAAALADAVARVLDDGDLRSRLASAARERVSTLPDEDAVLDQVTGIYRDLTTGHASRA